MSDRHIFACGGGHIFSTAPKLYGAMRALVAKPEPTVLYLPTATGDPEARVALFNMQAKEFGLKPLVLALFDSQSWTMTPAEIVDQADMVWVGGGSTFNMLTLWRAWNLIEPLRQAYDKGTPMAGVSAGAICWFEQGNTDSLGPGLNVMDCLGWVRGSCTPHYDSEPLRKPTLAVQLAEGRIKPGLAIDENCSVHLVNEQVSEVISEVEGALAYRVGAASVQPI